MPKFCIKSKKNLIIVLSTLFFVVCLIVANFLSTLFIRQTDSISENIKSNEYKLYLLSLGKSQLENEAKALAPDFQALGAGGYIWKYEDYYHVISSAFASKNDAELVQNSIKINLNLTSEIIAVTFPFITISGSFESEKSKVLTKSLASPYNFYIDVYDIAISLDTGVYNEISAKLALNDAHSTFGSAYANFQTLFPSTTAEPIKSLNEMLTSCIKSSQKLASGERVNQKQTYPSLIKYRYLEVLSIYYGYCKQ